VTGLSGSGKSSLAFDTIYAEGSGRYVETPVGYARQYLQYDGEARTRTRSTASCGHLEISAEDDLAEPALDGRPR
jgi:hypothetical protein